MGKIDIENIYKVTKQHYVKAKESLEIRHNAVYNESADAISDTIPGYKADYLEFGSYAKDNFAVLFVDMRNSTKRAETLGEEKTFLSMHAYIPALLQVIEHYDGKVVDIMGDGIMVFFGGRSSSMSKKIAVKSAGLCGKDMLCVRQKVINRIPKEDNIEWEIDFGVGVTYGKVIVTKIGINQFYDVKAFGDCVNKASKYSNKYNKVKVSKSVKHMWPKRKNGKIHFKETEDGEGYYLT